MRLTRPTALLVLSTLILLVTACTEAATQDLQVSDRPKVVATTTIVGDVVHNIAGDHVDLAILLPVGVDLHSFEPSPQDVAKIADADIVVANGAGLEEFLNPLLESTNATGKVLNLSTDIALLESASPDHVEEADAAGDPHVWTDPNNVLDWVAAIEAELSQIDPADSARYRTNAEQYREQLNQLHAWILEQVTQIPVENREIVTDHLFLAYFANQYGFTQTGAIIPAYSTLAEPSAQGLAQIEDAIRELDVKAVFVGNTVNPTLAQRLAEDTGVALVFLYTGSLSAPGGEADSYLEYMRYNVQAIVEALK